MSGLPVQEATAINNTGQVVGYAGGSPYVGYGQGFLLTPVRIPGDINGDGVVDVADYDIWAANVGKTGAAWSQGDLSGDGLVDVADYDVWAANVGSTASVPEPATVGLLALGISALFARRSRARKQRAG
jgi:hypothetical protein